MYHGNAFGNFLTGNGLRFATKEVLDLLKIASVF